MNKQQDNRAGRLIYLIPLIIIAISLFVLARPKLNPDVEFIERGEDSTYNNIGRDSIVVVYNSFDPNTADYRELISSGVPRNIAVSLLKWREAGKIFRIKEDVALCYGMTDSLYFLLEPYITIGEEYKIERNATYKSSYGKPRTTNKERHKLKTELIPFSLDTVSASYLELLGFTPKQAELVLRYREIIGGYPSFEKFAECYAVDSTMAERLRPYIVFKEQQPTVTEITDIEFPIEINSADAEMLIRINGIGEKSAKQIVRYRELLGGYHSVEQISELQVVTTENFLRILPQIWCDDSKIKKININFATQNELETHPYLSSRMLKRIINKRLLKGGWSTIEEMIEDNIFSADEAARIAPYLQFGTNPE